ncbi:hypothetical protein B0H12DRAFT_1081233, partial [Mycena haematopus]
NAEAYLRPPEPPELPPFNFRKLSGVVGINQCSRYSVNHPAHLTFDFRCKPPDFRTSNISSPRIPPVSFPPPPFSLLPARDIIMIQEDEEEEGYGNDVTGATSKPLA